MNYHHFEKLTFHGGINLLINRAGPFRNMRESITNLSCLMENMPFYFLTSKYKITQMHCVTSPFTSESYSASMLLQIKRCNACHLQQLT